MYAYVVKVLLNCSLAFIPLKRILISNYIVPEFTEYVKYFHTEARNTYVVLRVASKPCDHHTRYTMNITRLHFKHSLHRCKFIEDRCRAGVMAESLKQKDLVGF